MLLLHEMYYAAFDNPPPRIGYSVSPYLYTSCSSIEFHLTTIVQSQLA